MDPECRRQLLHQITVVGPTAFGAEGVAELRLRPFRDVRLYLSPASALVSNAFTEPADRQHSLEDVELPPLLGDVTDDLNQREQDHDVDGSVQELELPGAGDVPHGIE